MMQSNREFPQIIASQTEAAEIKGNRAQIFDFLNRVTTQNFKDFAGMARAALLDPQGKILQLMTCLERPQSLFILSPKSLTSNLLQDLETLHFAEDFMIKESKEIPEEFSYSKSHRDLTDLIWLKDISPGDFILETPLRSYVAEQKGCYPGQEAIEKTLTYGSPPKKLIPIKLLVPAKEGDALIVNNQVVGVITSLRPDGTAIGKIKRPYFYNLKTTDAFEVLSFPDDFIFSKKL